MDVVGSDCQDKKFWGWESLCYLQERSQSRALKDLVLQFGIE